MKIEIKVPAMGESISEATIGTFLKPSGSAVRESEEIVEIETDKVNQPLYAPAAGEISWVIKEGESVAIGTVIGFVDTDKKGVAEIKEEKVPEKVAQPLKVAEPEKVVQPQKVQKQESGIRQGCEEFIQGFSQTAAKIEKPVQEEEERETRTKMSRIRKTIANRLVNSLHEAAMLTTFNEVDMSAIMLLRAKHKESFFEKHGVKLGFMSFFVKAVVEGLKAFPDFNSYLSAEDVVQRNYYDIGIAVGTERGLVVPVIRNCDKLNFGEIEQQIAAFADRARKGALRIEDLEGGGFTITNGGIYGSLLSTPILNPPQVGILGMHAILKRPVAVDEKVEIRPMMYLALSYDHRIVDGKEAVSFLVHIKKFLEDPACMMLL